MYYKKLDENRYEVLIENGGFSNCEGHISIYTSDGVTVYFKQFYCESSTPENLRKIADFMDEIKQLTLNQE